MSDIDNDPNLGKVTARCHSDLIKDNMLYDENSQNAQTRKDKGYKDVAYPRTINIRGKK